MRASARSSVIFLAITASLATDACFDFEEPQLMRAADPGGANGGGVAGASAGQGGAGAPAAGGSGGGAPNGSGGSGTEQDSGIAGSAAGSGGTNLAEIPTDGLLLWFSADHGVDQDADGFVARWENRIASGSDATQSLQGSKPRMVDGSGPLSMLEFDGVSGHLVLGPGFQDFSAGLSFFVVTRELEALSCPSLLYLGQTVWIDDISFANDHAYGLYYRVGGTRIDGSGLELGVTYLMGVVHSADENVDVYLNGQPMLNGISALPPGQTRERNFIGRTADTDDCDEFLHGRIGEMLLYDRDVTLEERLQVEDYLQAKWQCCGN